MIGIEPIVTKVGGFTVPCHTITAASPLNLVPRARIELAKTGYQPIIIPFNYPGIKLGGLEG